MLTYQNSHRGGGGLPPRRVVSMHTLGRIMCLQWGHLADVRLHMNLSRFCRSSTVAILAPQANGWSAAFTGSAAGASAAEACIFTRPGICSHDRFCDTGTRLVYGWNSLEHSCEKRLRRNVGQSVEISSCQPATCLLRQHVAALCGANLSHTAYKHEFKQTGPG